MVARLWKGVAFDGPWRIARSGSTGTATQLRVMELSYRSI